jgi:hypothetical protein
MLLCGMYGRALVKAGYFDIIIALEFMWAEKAFIKAKKWKNRSKKAFFLYLSNIIFTNH